MSQINATAAPMNPIREAAEVMAEMKALHRGLSMKMTVDREHVRLLGMLGNRDLERAVSWTQIEQANFNLLAAEVALVANKLTARPE